MLTSHKKQENEPMNQGCPIFSRNHIEESVHGSGRFQITTKNGISPKLNGVFRVLHLNRLTRAQMGEEDQGKDAAMFEQQMSHARIARRIPSLMNSVWKNQEKQENVMKIFGLLRANTPDNKVRFLEEYKTEHMKDVTHAIYEDCPHDLKEYIETKDVNQQTKDVNQQTMLQWAFELISAIDHLHTKIGVMHRRINPETVYIFEEDDGKTTLKLGDILFARRPTFSDVTAERNVPIAYAAPETFSGPGSQSANYGLPADIWSYGMVVYFITRREDPYLKDVTRYGGISLRNHILNKPRPTLKDDLDETLKEIITNCWITDSTERFTAAEIKKKLASKINGQN